MKISLNWLTDYVDITLSAEQLAECFTHVGLNCDGFAETASDIVFELDVTSNRPDWLGHIGVARELSAATGAAFHAPVIGRMPMSGHVEKLTSVQVLDADLCPRYTARVIRGVKVGPSPEWLRERLEAVGLRSINNVVDVTNFVLFEYSQPLHSFDFDKLQGRRIVVRRAKPGEHLVSIDGTKCTLDESMLVIADAARSVAIAGIMGGLDTEVTGATVDVLIESAQFDPLATRRTSRSLGLMSDSNYRFERGVDPVGLDRASLRACQLIIQLGGGELAEGVADVWANPHVAPEVSLRPQRTGAVLGLDVPVERQVAILDRLGLKPRADAGRIVCTIPPFRRDLKGEIDLIEEVARLHGYDKIPVAGKVVHKVVGPSPVQRLREQIGRCLTAAGFDEAVTFSFVDQAEADLLGYTRDKTIAVNPINRKTNNVLRPSLLPSLLHACKTNQDAGNADVSLFELAAVFPAGGPGGLPDERVELGLVSTGDLRDLRGAIEALVLDVDRDARVEAQACEAAGLAANAAATILIDGQAAGVLGVVGAAARAYYGLERDVVAASLRFDALLARAGRTRTYRPVGKFPAVRRDLSVIVEELVTWRQVMEVIGAVSQPMRTGVDYVTTYRGRQIGEGKKSVTFTLTYRSNEGTLRGEQADEQVAQVVAAFKARLGAELRT